MAQTTASRPEELSAIEQIALEKPLVFHLHWDGETEKSEGHGLIKLSNPEACNKLLPACGPVKGKNKGNGIAILGAESKKLYFEKTWLEPVNYEVYPSRDEARRSGRYPDLDPFRRAGALYYNFGELEDSFLSSLPWIDQPLVIDPWRMEDAAYERRYDRGAAKGKHGKD